MAGNTLNRPLFRRGDRERVHAYTGGLKGLYNLFFGGSKQGELFKYGPNVPVTTVDELGQVKTVNTQTVNPKRRYDVETNIYNQPINDQFYDMSGTFNKENRSKFPPIVNRTEASETTDLFGNTIKTPASTTFNFGNLYNEPFTNFGSIKARWAAMDPAQKKKVYRNILATGTAWTMMPQWLKEDPVAKEIIQEDVNATLEQEDLPQPVQPAVNYDEAYGDPIERDIDEVVSIIDQENTEKINELKEEESILNSSSNSALSNNDDPDLQESNENSLADGVQEEAENIASGGGMVGNDEMAMFDLTSAYLENDTSVDEKSVKEVKAELKELMGDDSKLMNTMMLLQLGLGMMTNTTNQSGIRGFLDVAGKTGSQILPIAMQNLQNKSKMDKELALAAYDIVREDRRAKNKQYTDIQNFYMKELIKKEFEGNQPKGTLRTVMKKSTIELPDGQKYETWSPIDQVFDKGERAQYYLDLSRNGNSDLGLMPGDIRISSDLDQASASAGNDPYQGDLTKSQRGEHLALSSVFEAALPDILNIQMNPQYGLYSGQFPTGVTGGFGKFARTSVREAKQIADRLGIPAWLIPYTENVGGASLAALDVQMNNNMIFSSAQANSVSETGKEDIYKGEAIGPDGVTMTGEWATDAYVKNLISNPSLDIVEQLQNRMGFLAARLKQPTGRLLADTIRRSIEEVKMLGLGAGDPVQVSHRLHQFTKDLYQQYVKHSLMGGGRITTSWAVDPGIYGKERISIKDYQDGYYNFIGGSQNSPNLPIDMSWIQVNDSITSSAPAYSGDSSATIDAVGPINWFDLMNKWLPEGDQTFGGKNYTGNE